ncbi:unnamed protein product [Acanthosepion pharaonis]|uniref:RNase H type-1 domain-containing protein n=1 Tax=Acanthosepion pharaonis TaxID=158019 RepID=A0A812ED76_ACAPH|nr:unnamed protein product [Sepia pharaonis]
MVGDYPIAGWLRIACSYLKRRAGGIDWEDIVDSESTSMVQEVVEEVRHHDPVRGRWHVPKMEKGVVWCDASSMATGVCIEIDGAIVEDAAWLRKKRDYIHINVAELDGTIKGVKLALKWGLKEIEIRTDSVTVRSWISLRITGEKRIRTKGAAELIIMRRLGILREIIDEFNLKLSVTFVPSDRNKADALTRVKKSWLKVEKAITATCRAGRDEIKELHGLHHVEVDRTLYLVRKVYPEMSRDTVQKVVRSCDRCQSIDPSPNVHELGEIQVDTNWTRLSIDVTHYRGEM